MNKNQKPPEKLAPIVFCLENEYHKDPDTSAFVTKLLLDKEIIDESNSKVIKDLLTSHNTMLEEILHQKGLTIEKSYLAIGIRPK